jgi:hypothetical protein
MGLQILACSVSLAKDNPRLQWGKIDFEQLTIRIQRSFVEGEIYPRKTLRKYPTSWVV